MVSWIIYHGIKVMALLSLFISTSSITLSERLILKGRHPHLSKNWLRYFRVLQFCIVSPSWQPVWPGPSWIYSSVTFISFRILRLYWPSPTNFTGSVKERYKVVPKYIWYLWYSGELRHCFSEMIESGLTVNVSYYH